MAGFFRRLRRPKEGPPEEEVEGEEPLPPEGDETAETGDAVDGTSVEAPESTAIEPPEVAEEPRETIPDAPASFALPPPLPEADGNAAHSSIARHRLPTTCFLCGTTLDGPWCPKCRMAWVE